MSDPNDSEAQTIKEIVQLHARQIGEYVDSVQIFVTKQSDCGKTTRSYEFGTGNFQARICQVKEWVIMQDEYAKVWARKKQEDDL